jgi:hypothetical protein
MTQPKWREVAQTDFYRLLVDDTGVYDPEVEIADEIGDPGFNLYRVELERFKTVIVGGTRYLVPIEWTEEWPHETPQYQPWFYDDLESIASSTSETREDLISQLCSEDPKERLGVYLSIGGHWGWENFDGYPLVLSEQELHERWEIDEPDPKEPFRYRLPDPGFNPGGGSVYVEKGHLIVYRGEDEKHFGRVLDRVLRDPHNGKRYPGKMLRVLHLTEDGHAGSLRFVPIEDILYSRPASTAVFLQWFLSSGPADLDPDTIVTMGRYGSLSDSYIRGALERLENTGDFRISKREY